VTFHTDPSPLVGEGEGEGDPVRRPHAFALHAMEAPSSVQPDHVSLVPVHFLDKIA
jgi:hypothetical protein